MEWVKEYWFIVVALIGVVISVGVQVRKHVNLPAPEQLDKVREWLLWAVVQAEKSLGGGTGQLKLRQVYDLFLQRFPQIAALISFDIFAKMVDNALEEMREMLHSNQAVQKLVKGVDNHE